MLPTIVIRPREAPVTPSLESARALGPAIGMAQTTAQRNAALTMNDNVWRRNSHRRCAAESRNVRTKVWLRGYVPPGSARTKLGEHVLAHAHQRRVAPEPAAAAGAADRGGEAGGGDA